MTVVVTLQSDPVLRLLFMTPAMGTTCLGVWGYTRFHFESLNTEAVEARKIEKQFRKTQRKLVRQNHG